MVGREIKGHYYRVDNDGYSDEVVLKADCITTMESLLCFDLELHKQEILGIGGLSDCGMHTLGRALYGLDEIVDGEVVLPKTGVKIKNAQVAFRNSMGYVSKNRDTESLELNASILPISPLPVMTKTTSAPSSCPGKKSLRGQADQGAADQVPECLPAGARTFRRQQAESRLRQMVR